MNIHTLATRKWLIPSVKDHGHELTKLLATCGFVHRDRYVLQSDYYLPATNSDRWGRLREQTTYSEGGPPTGVTAKHCLVHELRCENTSTEEIQEPISDLIWNELLRIGALGYPDGKLPHVRQERTLFEAGPSELLIIQGKPIMASIDNVLALNQRYLQFEIHMPLGTYGNNLDPIYAYCDMLAWKILCQYEPAIACEPRDYLELIKHQAADNPPDILPMGQTG